MKFTIAMSFLIGLGVSGVAHAAESPAADSVALTVPEVEVHALRGRDALRDIAAPVFLMTRGELTRAGTERVATLLGRLPGLHAYGSSGIGEPRTVDPRGFTANGESSYLKLLVNGQDVRGVENGDVDWDWVMTDDVERLEVIQGPGAWLYGDGTEGGVVNVVRRDPATGFRSDCMLRAGSFGLLSGNLVGSGGSGPWRGGVRGSARVADGFRDRSEESVYTGGGDLAWNLSERSRLALDVSVLDTRHEDPGALTVDQLRADRDQADTQTDYAHARRNALGLHFVHRPDPSQEWQISPYLRTEEVDQIRTLVFEAKSHPTEATTVGGEASWRGQVRRIGLNVGVQAEHARLQSDYRSIADGTLEARGTGDRDAFAGYASARIPLGQRASMRLGLRGDWIVVGPLERLGAAEIPSRTLSAASPFVALSREIPNGSVWANASTAFRVPTLNQLFDQRVLGGSFVISNPGLDPQRSLNFEIGARREVPGGGSATLAVYSSQVEDEIDFDLSTFSYANIGESWHRGVEAALTQPLGGPWSATAIGAWTPTTIEGGVDDGNQINAVPEGTAYGALRWNDPRWSVEGGVRYTGRQFLDKANDHALPDYATLELAASARLARARLTLRVANLLDHQYEESGFLGALGEERFYPAPGRSASLGLSFD
jgi:iron complex outermembrane recepter protein